MALFNYATKEITLKIVYYGPGLSGKTTNLQHLHTILDPSRRGKLLSLSTEADRTLFFDFMPVELGKIKDFSIRFQLYTVPGQVRYNATRRLVLKGADAVVFVADSQKEMLEENLESLKNMRENLIANNIDPDDIPLVIQYNKRDLPNILPVHELNERLNPGRVPYFESVAVEGKGVKETFETITRLLLKHISQKHKIDIRRVEPAETPVFDKEPQKVIKAKEERKTPDRVPEHVSLTKEEQAGTDILTEIRNYLIELSNNTGEIKEGINKLIEAIEALNRNISERISREDEMLNLLKEIKSSIDDARRKKKWLLFN
jgi:hypothetical protein